MHWSALKMKVCCFFGLNRQLRDFSTPADCISLGFMMAFSTPMWLNEKLKVYYIAGLFFRCSRSFSKRTNESTIRSSAAEIFPSTRFARTTEDKSFIASASRLQLHRKKRRSETWKANGDYEKKIKVVPHMAAQHSIDSRIRQGNLLWFYSPSRETHNTKLIMLVPFGPLCEGSGSSAPDR